MSYGVTLLKFRNGQWDAVPPDALVGVLERHGCLVAKPKEGSNDIGLPRDAEAGIGQFAEFAVFTIKDGQVTEFGMHRPEGTTQCRALLFSLINELGLAMFHDQAREVYAREDVFNDIPPEILSQFPASTRIVVKRPEDCV